MAGGSAIAPVLLTLGADLDLPRQSVGLVLSMFALGAAATVPFAGLLIDRIGRREVLVPALLLNAAAGFAAAASFSFGSLLACRFLQGVATACFLPAVTALVRDNYPVEARRRAMGLISSFISCGSVVSPLIGGSLSLVHWRLSFAFFGLTLLLAPVVWLQFPPRVLPDKVRSLRGFFRQMATGLRRPAAAGVVVVGFATFLVLYATSIFLPMLVKERLGSSDFIAGVLLSVQGLSSAALALQAHRVSARLGPLVTLGTGFMLAAVGALFYALWPGPGGIIGGLLCAGAGFGLIMPTANFLITVVVPGSIVGTASAAFNMMKYVGQFSSPLLYAPVLLAAGYRGVFLAAGAFSASCGLLALALVRRGREITPVEAAAEVPLRLPVENSDCSTFSRRRSAASPDNFPVPGRSLPVSIELFHSGLKVCITQHAVHLTTKNG